MEPLPTPSTDKGNHKTRVTPNRKRSPGDALGSGKSQIRITQYYSPVGSSEQGSQPLISKRRASPESRRPKKRLRPKASVDHLIIISSDDSSNEIFTDPRPDPKPVLPKSRLDTVKRCLYPETSSQSSSKSSSRPKQKLLKTQRKLRRIRFLSSDDSPEESMDSKPLPDVRLPFSQSTRRICPDMLSQSVVISSSEDSDFELHNSKLSQSFASQSMSKDSPQATQSFLSRQTNTAKAGSSFAGSIAPKVLSKRSAASTDRPKKASNTKKTTQEQFDDTIDPCRRRDSSLLSPEAKDEFDGSVDGDVASIYLEDTIPPHRTNHIEPSPEKVTDSFQDSSNYITPNAVLDCRPSIYDHETVNLEAVYMDQTVDKRDKSLLSPETKVIFDGAVDSDVASIYLQATIPPSYLSKRIEPSPEKVNGSPETPSGSFLDSSKYITPNAVLDCDPSIYDHETVNAEAVYMDQTVDVGHDGTPITKGLANMLENTLQLCPRNGVVECSDDDMDESGVSYWSDVGYNRTSLGVIPLTEITHVSDSDVSDIPDSLGESSVVDASIGMFPRSPLSPQNALLLADNSDDSSAGITPILNGVLDASADFFSDVVSSFGTCGSEEGLNPQIDGKYEQIVDADAPKTDESTGVANLEMTSAGQALDLISNGDVQPKAAEEKDSGHGGSRQENESLDQSLNVDHESGSFSGSRSQPCGGENDESALDNTASTITADGSLGCSCDPSPVDQLACEEAANPVTEFPQIEALSIADLVPKPVEIDGSLEGVGQDNKPAEICTDAPTDNSLNEIKIVCSVAPPETSSGLRIAANLDKSLLHNAKRPLLLDTILSECRNYAEPVLNLEPIKTFVSQYSGLPPTAKSALHGCLLDLLEDCDRWLKYSEFSTGIDHAVSAGILEYLNTNDNLITKLNWVTFHELADIFAKLNNPAEISRKLNDPASESIETLRNTVFTKLSSIHPNDRKEVIDMINRKFVKLTERARFCLKICLELFALPLNLNDKLYKFADIARFANSLIREQMLNKNSPLPLKKSAMCVNPGRLMCDLTDICRLKSNVLDTKMADSIYYRINDVCSTLAVLDVSAETDPFARASPTFRLLVNTHVHALDELLMKLFAVDAPDVEFGACIYLGFLLKQDVTGFQHKVKWCRERMRHLWKLLDASNIFEEFSKTLKEPVSPVESIVRTEFVSNALKMKKSGLTADEKSDLTKLLRPAVHARTRIVLSPLDRLNNYDVLVRKPKIKNIDLVRANILEYFKSDFPSGVEDNGGLLTNAVFLTFWQAIYLPLDGVFLSSFQKSPLDWGSEQFFARREIVITRLATEIAKIGLPAMFKSIESTIEKFSSHRCIVDWNLVFPNLHKIHALVEALGSDRFLKIAVHLLGKLDERSLGFPEMVLWNGESKRVKFLGLKKPNDPLYPYQVLWLEKLADFGAEAEELQVSGCTGPEQFSQLK